MTLRTSVRRARDAVGRRLGSSALYSRVIRPFSREAHVVAAGLIRYRSDETRASHRWHLVRNVHMIEKGLTMRPRRDAFAVDYIAETVELWSGGVAQLGPQESAWVTDVLVEYFEATASTADPVIRRAKSRAAEVGLLRRRDSDDSATAPTTQRSGPHHPSATQGVVDIDDLTKLARGRRSVRWFLPDPVPRRDVDAAVAVALESPTACNRQPYRFLIVDDERAHDVLSVPMGTHGYAHQVPGVVVVIGDWSAFFDKRDAHVPYIDASLASMGLILALESQGIASCCINWPDVRSRERAMRALLNLPDHERVVMLIAYGFADPASLVPFSAKREVDDIRSFGVPHRDGAPG